MHKTWVITVREYLAAVRTKSFLVSVVFMPLLMVGSAGIPILLDKIAGNKSQRFAVIDRTPGRRLYGAIEAAARRRNTVELSDPESRKPMQVQAVYLVEPVDPSAASAEAIDRQRLELSQRVRQGSLSGFLDIGPDVAVAGTPEIPAAPSSERASVRYLSNNPLQDGFARWAERVINEAIVAQRCREAGLTPAKVASLVQPVRLRIRGLVSRNAVNGAFDETSDVGRAGMLLVPAALTVLMFLVIMIGATPLMQSVIEEKMQRIAEVLLGSVQPFALMAGKLLGIVGVTLTLGLVYLGGGYAALYRLGFTEYLPLELLAWFLLFQVLAVLMYGSLFIAIGAACTDAKECQTLMIPLVMVITLPLFALRHVVQDPNSSLAFWASLFPFATPMLMVMRLGLPPGIPWWQPAVGAIGTLATTCLCVYAAGRIFRVGILMQGKAAKLSEMASWIVRG